MFLTLWEFEVKPCEEKFEKACGPAGDWARLLRSDSNYCETRLLRDSFRLAIYLTLDFWNPREAYEQFMAVYKEGYQALDAGGEELTSKERQSGWYELVDP